MTIDEAIETQKKIRDGEAGIPEDKWIASCNLSIEALKRCKVLAENSTLWAAKPLPGETEE